LKAPVEGRIGFMQGRLSPLLDGRIQAFPREHWRQEFELGERLGFSSGRSTTRVFSRTP
jgi:hypothetical protein